MRHDAIHYSTQIMHKCFSNNITDIVGADIITNIICYNICDRGLCQIMHSANNLK